ncbi:other/FunK1 protein kinase [Coprinopsis cinerea AmutBmut pab1-1]|nr:other/FunK1 protein kinase [Coprinopsis cinerea AmutBmut pab1-1]
MSPAPKPPRKPATRSSAKSKDSLSQPAEPTTMFYHEGVDPSKDLKNLRRLKNATDLEISANHAQESITDALCFAPLEYRGERLERRVSKEGAVCGYTSLSDDHRARYVPLWKFGLVKTFGGGRKAWVTSNEAIQNFDEGDFPVPNICVTGKGDYLPADAQDPSNPSYERSIFFCVVQPDTEFQPRASQAYIFEPLARHIFYVQPHRRFFRMLLLSQSGHMCLFHFDRSGCIDTPSININEHPATFVRTILSLSSHDPSAAGFDPDIFWKWGRVGQKRVRQGYIRMKNQEGKCTLLNVVGKGPISIRPGVQGPANALYHVVDESGKHLIVKDAWKYTGGSAGQYLPRPWEHELLLAGKGLPGVCQIVDYSIGVSTTSFRGYCLPDVEFTHYRFSMEKYGNCALGFESAKQLTCGFRDAIAGHQRMYIKKNIIHRDISPRNIVFGTEDAEPGWEGVVIDPELGTYTNGHPEANEDHAIASCEFGTKAFTSMLIAETYHPDVPPFPHDHADDLESFFWSFLYVLSVYKEPGVKQSPRPKIIDDICSDNMADVYLAKMKFLAKGLDQDELDAMVSPFWGHLGDKGGLLDKFLDYISDLAFEKDNYLGNEEQLEAFVAKADEHYAKVLEIFQEAIDGFDKAENEDEDEDEDEDDSRGVLKPSGADNIPRGGIRGGKKRKVDDSDNEEDRYRKRARGVLDGENHVYENEVYRGNSVEV